MRPDYVDSDDLSKWTPDKFHHDTYTISYGKKDYDNADRRRTQSTMIFNEDNDDPADFKFSVCQKNVTRRTGLTATTGTFEVAARMFRSVPQDLDERFPRHDSVSTEEHITQLKQKRQVGRAATQQNP